MKRTLLITTAVMLASAASAQQVNFASELQAQPRPMSQKVQSLGLAGAQNTQAALSLLSGKQATTARRSAASGNYYAHPDGLYYKNWDATGMGDAVTMLVQPLGYSATYTQAGSASTTWKRQGSTVGSGRTYSFRAPFRQDFVLPVSVAGTDSFSLGMNNIYTYGVNNNVSGYADALGNPDAEARATMNWGAVSIDSVGWMGPVDDHGYTLGSDGSLYNNMVVFGNISTGFPFGSGTIDMSRYGLNVTSTSVAMDQVFTPTVAPLYVEAVAVKGLTTSATPLRNGATLTAGICGVKRLNNGTYAADPEQVLFVLTATATDVTVLTDENNTMTNTDGKKYYRATIVFSNKTTDEFGNQVPQSFVIPAGTRFGVYIEGFANSNGSVNTNVDFGATGLAIPAEDKCEIGHVYARQPNGTVNILGYNAGQYAEGTTYNTAADISLIGMYDGIAFPRTPGIWTFEDQSIYYNFVRVSADGDADGTNNLTEGATASHLDDEEGKGIPGGVLITTLDPFSNDNANYQIYNRPSWVTNMQLYSFSGMDAYKVYYVTATCEALPAGTSGRYAAITMANPVTGAYTPEPLFILQGDINNVDAYNDWLSQGKPNGFTTGIAETLTAKGVKKTDDRVFNLSGQQVSPSYKGIVIRNGKKYLQR